MTSTQERTKVQIVDEEDNVIGAEYLFDAIEMGAIRRASRVFIFNASGQFLMQQRSANVRKPLLYDQSVGGHVDEGETYQEAAVREMQEEVGISGYPLTEIVTSYRNPEFFNAIYKAVVPDNTPTTFDPEEVAALEWWEITTVDELIRNEPEKCTAAFVDIWQTFRDRLVGK